MGVAMTEAAAGHLLGLATVLSPSSDGKTQGLALSLNSALSR